VLLTGLIPVIPACLLAGIFLSKFFKKLETKPPSELFNNNHIPENLPGLFRSLLPLLTPVVLMLAGSICDLYYGITDKVPLSISIIKFLSDANIALLVAVLVGIATLGLRNGNSMEKVMNSLGKSVGAVAMILMIIAVGGAFSQIMKDSNINKYIASIAGNINFNPLILAFSVAAVIRFAVGSATVATMTAAPIMLPIAVQTGVAPELMVLATGSGSLMFSHFNDIGFWMFKEYFNVSIKHTFLIWTVMESIVGIVGLVAALILYQFFY